MGRDLAAGPFMARPPGLPAAEEPYNAVAECDNSRPDPRSTRRFAVDLPPGGETAQRRRPPPSACVAGVLSPASGAESGLVCSIRGVLGHRMCQFKSVPQKRGCDLAAGPFLARPAEPPAAAEPCSGVAESDNSRPDPRSTKNRRRTRGRRAASTLADVSCPSCVGATIRLPSALKAMVEAWDPP